MTSLPPSVCFHCRYSNIFGIKKRKKKQIEMGIRIDSVFVLIFRYTLSLTLLDHRICEYIETVYQWKSQTKSKNRNF